MKKILFFLFISINLNSQTLPGGNIIEFSDITDMKAYPSGRTILPQSMIFIKSVNLMYNYEPTSTSTDNGYDTLKMTNYSGRFIALFRIDSAVKLQCTAPTPINQFIKFIVVDTCGSTDSLWIWNNGTYILFKAGDLTTAKNGLSNGISGDSVKLGGTLTQPITTITASPSNVLAVTGIQSGTNSDSILVSDPITGVIKRVSWDRNNINNWSILGNAGTNPSTNFLGTSDNQDLMLRTNGFFGSNIRLKSTGHEFIFSGGESILRNQTQTNSQINLNYDGVGRTRIASANSVQLSTTGSTNYSLFVTPTKVHCIYSYNFTDDIFRATTNATSNIFSVNHAGFNGDNRFGLGTNNPTSQLEIYGTTGYRYTIFNTPNPVITSASFPTNSIIHLRNGASGTLNLTAGEVDDRVYTIVNRSGVNITLSTTVETANGVNTTILPSNEIFKIQFLSGIGWVRIQ